MKERFDRTQACISRFLSNESPYFIEPEKASVYSPKKIIGVFF